MMDWKQIFCNYFTASNEHQSDASHDLSHFCRVAETAKQIAQYEIEKVDQLVILAAAYFHDVVNLPKNHPESHRSSCYSAIKAREILLDMNFPDKKIDPVCRAIETHSFSAGLTPSSIEAKIIQDADRMESLGALGVMRTFYVSGRLEREPFDPADMFASRRPLNDKLYGLDHFYCKLFKLPSLLQTVGGRKIAAKRTEFLNLFVKELDSDVQRGEGGGLSLVQAYFAAGKNNRKLFDATDPWASKRQLEPDGFVVDCMLKAIHQFPEFISSFIAQLRDEISFDQESSS